MEAKTGRTLELVREAGAAKPDLDIETRRACRKIARWVLSKTDLTFGQRDHKFDYIADELEMGIPLFKDGFMALVRKEILKGGKTNENLKHFDMYTLQPDKLVSDAEIASKGLIKAITLLGNGNNDPIETSAA